LNKLLQSAILKLVGQSLEKGVVEDGFSFYCYGDSNIWTI